ncbi:unnamed protein product [Linum tenue]|uniref:Uncharacterized protein n=1 Tax=Linum tenue TaxID=586396 RepID=A0AAV0Q3M7_9ROSI|nr:unnamed protein product [Linum tenue]
MWRLLPGKVQGAKCVQRRRREHSGDGLRRGRPHGLHPQPTRLREDGASQLRAGAVQVRRGGGGVQEDPLPLRRLQHRLQSQGAQQVPRLPGRRPPLPSRPVRRHSGRHLAGLFLPTTYTYILSVGIVMTTTTNVDQYNVY